MKMYLFNIIDESDVIAAHAEQAESEDAARTQAIKDLGQEYRLELVEEKPQYRLDIDPQRKDVMVGLLSDGRRMCVAVDTFMDAMSWMEMSWLDVPENWLGCLEPGKVWIEDVVVQQV